MMGHIRTIHHLRADYSGMRKIGTSTAEPRLLALGLNRKLEHFSEPNS
jgi:hypothetical protein